VAKTLITLRHGCDKEFGVQFLHEKTFRDRGSGFGMGWGAVGLCPGPAIASLAFLNFYSIIFVASMVFGFFTLKFFDKLN